MGLKRDLADRMISSINEFEDKFNELSEQERNELLSKIRTSIIGIADDVSDDVATAETPSEEPQQNPESMSIGMGGGVPVESMLAPSSILPAELSSRIYDTPRWSERLSYHMNLNDRLAAVPLSFRNAPVEADIVSSTGTISPGVYSLGVSTDANGDVRMAPVQVGELTSAMNEVTDCPSSPQDTTDVEQTIYHRLRITDHADILFLPSPPVDPSGFSLTVYVTPTDSVTGHGGVPFLNSPFSGIKLKIGSLNFDTATDAHEFLDSIPRFAEYQTNYLNLCCSPTFAPLLGNMHEAMSCMITSILCPLTPDYGVMTLSYNSDLNLVKIRLGGHGLTSLQLGDFLDLLQASYYSDSFTSVRFLAWSVIDDGRRYDDVQGF